MHVVKRLSSRARLCPLCQAPMKKKGFTSAGRQRWYCASCRYSPTSTRTDKARHTQFKQFTDYVTDTLPQRALHTTSSSSWQ
ncbi:IS1/IS1595 family N-terminal zinc-binding domain-containing protein [Flaviflexus ciconiae]